ncbi:MAG: T9SS type A sorting domain-containing protein, partial [candidate division WOR-3 bacterium]|nr:T9SS type A sorting domain-containing protein [candidate division WOR-3 bacterium]
FNPDGDTLWTKRYDYADSMETARSMYLDNLGNIYVTGQSNGLGRAYDIATIKYFQSDFTVRDVRVSKLEVPALVDSNDVVAPACSVYNNGDSTENYQVRMKIGSFYNNTLPVTNHAPGTYQYLTFPNWTAIQRGYQIVSCSTELAIDMIHSNDRKIDSVLVRVLDVGVTKIEVPSGIIDSGTVVTPACSVYNYGSTNETYSVRMKIGTFYDNIATLTNHAPGSYRYIEFSDWNVTEMGTHVVSCSTELTGDVYNTNDRLTGSVEVIRPVVPPTGWVKMANIPIAPSGKKPKSGSCMAGMRNYIYFLKASNRNDFYSYDPNTNTWTELETIPKGIKEDGDGKKPKKGAAMVAYQQEHGIYVLRGNNTLGFWKYQADTIGDTILPGWYKLANILPGLKRCKDGSGLATFRRHGNGYIFAMKGSKTNEFYVYHIEGDSWTQVSSPPIGTSGKLGYKKGSCLAYDGDEFVYVLQGYYGGFFKYSVDTDSWIELTQYNYKAFLNRDGKKKKPKDGAALVYLDSFIYMLKGGNTREIWKIDVSTDTGTWVQMDTFWDIPLGDFRRKVKGGGCMIEFNDYFYAAKGKNTDEFYRHELPMVDNGLRLIKPIPQGEMNRKMIIDEFALKIAPNPAINATIVKYVLPKASPVSLKLYNVNGALVKTYANSKATVNGEIRIDAKSLSSGVYILRFFSNELKVTRKLVLEK